MTTDCNNNHFSSHAESSTPSNSSLLDLFLTAKEVEGCSPRTITYYESTLKHMDE